jgi:hypothetical protein
MYLLDCPKVYRPTKIDTSCHVVECQADLSYF